MQNRAYSYTRVDNLLYYIRFFFYQFFFLFETESGKFQQFIVELLWTFRPLTHINPLTSFGIFAKRIKTTWGIFFIDKTLQTIVETLPSFERDDIIYTIKLLKGLVKRKKKILFLDVGAGIGNYTIAVGNAFKKNKYITLIAFEPNANNFSADSYMLLKKNISVNSLKGIKLLKIGLGSEDNKKKNKFGIQTKRLDTLLPKNYIKKFDCIFMKIDIEGYEKYALAGSRQTIHGANEFYLLIEDCVDTNLPKLLSKNFLFLEKKTPYNSFWKKI